MTQTLTLDLAAPIFPGVGAAGLTLGTRVATLPPDALARFRSERIINTCIQAPTGEVFYRAPGIEFMATNGVIDQIVTLEGYTGYLGGTVRPGMTVAEVEAELGPIVEDDEDALLLRDVPGIALDVTLPPGTSLRGDWADADRDSTARAIVSAIIIYRPHDE